MSPSGEGPLHLSFAAVSHLQLADAGPSSIEGGNGGRLLFLPHGYKETPPAGYTAILSQN
jgi:hypothetical protein